jgi:hypothetical protein
MSDQLTADLGTLEFLRQLLEIAQGSDHPMDKALTKVLSRQIMETETVRNSPQAEDSDNGQDG